MSKLGKMLRGKTNSKRNKELNIKINLLAYVNNTHFSGDNYIDRFCRIRNSNIGFYTYIGYNSDLNNVEIGNYCSISSDVKIGLGKHPIDYVSTSPVFYSEKNPFDKKINKIVFNDEPSLTKIGHDVWIGTNVVIMDGVKIGTGSVIAAGSIVTKDVDEFTIVGGVPSKPIRKRFEEETIEKLNDVKWWLKRPEEMKENIQFINCPKTFLSRME